MCLLIDRRFRLTIGLLSGFKIDDTTLANSGLVVSSEDITDLRLDVESLQPVFGEGECIAIYLYIYIYIYIYKARIRRHSAQTMTDVDYADDIVLLANTPIPVESLLNAD